MNDLSTVKPLYPGAFPQPDAGDDDAPYPTPAARPLNSRLECNTTTSVFGLARPDWHAGLKECLTELGVST